MINPKPKILFIVGSALGHVGRSLVIAQALSRQGFDHIQFTGPVLTNNKAYYIINKEYPFIPIPSPQRDKLIFADLLESIIRENHPDLICLDLTPTWISFVQFPKIPVIYITNWFLTSLGSRQTLQDKWFNKNQHNINMLRVKKNLNPLKNARELYQKDLILLCDPCILVPNNSIVNMSCVGHSAWAKSGDLPNSLKKINHYIFISFGSTGRRMLPSSIIEKIADLMNTKNIVWVGCIDDTIKSTFSKHYQYLIYPQLPIIPIIKKASFVITHGGSGSTYPALLEGKAIGTWSNNLNHQLLSNTLHKKELAINLENKSDLNIIKIRKIEKNSIKLSKSKIKKGSGPDNAAKCIIEFINQYQTPMI